MGKRKESRNQSYAIGNVSPGIVILLAFVGLFAILLMVVALTRGAL